MARTEILIHRSIVRSLPDPKGPARPAYGHRTRWTDAIPPHRFRRDLSRLAFRCGRVPTKTIVVINGGLSHEITAADHDGTDSPWRKYGRVRANCRYRGRRRARRRRGVAQGVFGERPQQIGRVLR